MMIASCLLSQSLGDQPPGSMGRKRIPSAQEAAGAATPSRTRNDEMRYRIA
jgi:hypothetical protein